MKFRKVNDYVSKSVLLLVLLLGIGCTRPPVAKMFSLRTGCPEHSTHVKEIQSGTYEVTGCDQEAIFRCDTEFGFQSKRTVCAEVGGDSPPAAAPAPVAVQPEPPRAAVDGDRVTVTIPVGGGHRVVLLGNPVKYPGEVALILFMSVRMKNRPSCPIQLVVDGDLIAPLKAKHRAERRHDRYSAKLSIEQVEALANAERIAGKVCDTRWAVSPRGMDLMRQFVVRYKEEQALSGSGEPKEEPSTPTMRL